MRIIEETQLGFDDVLIRPARSNINSRSEVNCFREFSKETNGIKKKFTCIPVCCANMGSIATTNMAKIFVKNGFLCALEKHIFYGDIYDLYLNLMKDEINDKKETYEYCNRIAISIGIKETLDDLIQLNKMLPCGINIINIDIANGYITKLQDRVKEIRNLFPEAWIIAGTVVTSDIVIDLLNAGADIIRCGIGGGSMCLTRAVTGVGRPQVSMLIECSDAAHQMKGYIMSDGGCKNSGDICKALGLSDFAMVGSMFASAEEADGELIELDGIRYKKFAGMSSEYAQNRYFGGFKSNYRSSEGRQKLIPISGPLEDIINHIKGGINSCMTYIGCHSMKHFQKHCTFYKVNRQLNMSMADKKDF